MSYFVWGCNWQRPTSILWLLRCSPPWRIKLPQSNRGLLTAVVAGSNKEPRWTKQYQGRQTWPITHSKNRDMASMIGIWSSKRGCPELRYYAKDHFEDREISNLSSYLGHHVLTCPFCNTCYLVVDPNIPKMPQQIPQSMPDISCQSHCLTEL